MKSMQRKASSTPASNSSDDPATPRPQLTRQYSEHVHDQEGIEKESHRTIEYSLREKASGVVATATALAAMLKREKTVKLDDVCTKAMQLVDHAADFRSEVTSVANDLRHEIAQNAAAFRDAVPTVCEVANTVKRAEVPTFITQSPLLFGLFVQPPQWPPARISVASFPRRMSMPLAFITVIGVLLLGASTLSILILPFFLPLLMLLVPLFVPVLLLLRSRRKAARAQADLRQKEAEAEASVADWREEPARYYSTNTKVSSERRRREAEDLIDAINGRAPWQQLSAFNSYILSATGLAVYGCGVVAATHVGGLRALERHGLNYEQLTTLAGVSAGAVVVAMLAVGCRAEELNQIIQGLDFTRLARPEIGSILRIAVDFLLSLGGGGGGGGGQAALHLGGGGRSDGSDKPPFTIAGLLAERGHGPGVNSGSVLEQMIGEALRTRCGEAEITLAGVQRRFGKRLVLITTEMDTGKERRLTPEADPELPVRVAVRMSMGIPGVFEPLKYQGHVYCDGGLINDFPMNALPEGGRLGLCVKQKEYYFYNMSPLERLLGEAQLKASPRPAAELGDAQSTLWRSGVYPTQGIIDFATTTINIMMDANLALQIEKAENAARQHLGSQWGLHGGLHEQHTTRDEQRHDLFALAPQILTLCSGGLQPFDFSLKRHQHHEMYLAGQLMVHLHACQLPEPHELPSIMSDEQKLKALLFVLYLEYPPAGTQNV
eukprot:CAMPEP_0119305014 /NCGR_PEP_ID=MMETSP1333-20130426/6104_1 /TAXON_ID=418940 /ORGANISM="Scyphosphaera apsteinii, Strain RCC1455" /LENGTH=719 /DNA_ID=CAMNT_0007308011 /DNA_START=141 /DNA_END=2300 /DNA_ORIENTATION=+